MASHSPDYTSNVLTYQPSKTTNGTQHITAETYTPPQTPTATTTSAHNLFAEIQNIHTALSSLPTLEPGEEINALLTQLVNLCISPYPPTFTSAFLAIPSVPTLCSQLRPLCASAEGSLETYWAKRIIHSASTSPSPSRPRAELLALFPYYENYLDLSSLEASTLSAFLPPSNEVENIAFLGSGPLPLTSLCMLERFPAALIHNIDRDQSALSVSQDLCSILGVQERMKFGLEDVGAGDDGEGEGEGGALEEGKGTDWASFDVLFLAALVGMDNGTKMGILASLARKMRPRALVVARSARGLRSVLYPVLELSSELEKMGLEVLAEVHPWTKVVNSVVVMRVKER